MESSNTPDIDSKNLPEAELAPHRAGHSHAVKIKKLERPTKVLVKMLLEVPGDVVKQHRKHTVSRFSQIAKIPGFRPGKAPAKMIEEKFKEDIQKEMLSHLVESSITEALVESKINPLSRPKINFKQFSDTGETPLEFEVEFEVQPEIELRNYKGFKISKPSEEVKEADITQAIDNLRDRLSVLEPVENQKPEKGLFAVVEIGYEVHSDPPKKEEAKPFTVELGAGNLLPELDEALVTMEIGESRTINAKFPDDYSDKELTGKSAVYECKIVELKKKVMPALDDAFSNTLKEGMTLEQLTQEIRENLKSAKIEESKRETRKQTLDQLIAKNPCELPDSMVQDQMVRLAEWMKEDFKRRGLPFGEFKEKDLEALRKRSEEMVSGSLLLREVALKEKLTLDTARIDERVKEYAQQMDRTIEDATKYLVGKGMLDRLKDEVLTDQVYEFLLSHAELTESANKS